MGWLTTPNTDYTITSQKSTQFSTMFLVDGVSVSHYFRRTTTSKWAGSMTFDAAVQAKVDYLTAHPYADVQVERQTDSGAYKIVINEETVNGWTPQP